MKLAAAIVFSCVGFASGCGSDHVQVAGGESRPFAVLAAFPAEMVPLLEQAVVHDTAEINGRSFRIGTIAGKPVIVGLTGIGLLNAGATTRALLERFAVRGVIMSAVAGSPQRIGDVVVAASWTVRSGASHAVDADWLTVAARIAGDDSIELQRCTIPPSEPQRGEVCVSHVPAIFVGGTGRSSDSFGSTPFACRAGGDEIFGCDIPLPHFAQSRRTARGSAPPVAVDMESAAVAAEAAAHGVPFIAFRGVSDGSNDPLDLPGFPAQFLAYYRLAARNAAAAALAFLDALPD